MSFLGRLTNLGKGVLRSRLSPDEDPPLHLADEPRRPLRRSAQEVGREEGIEVKAPEEPLPRTLGEAEPAGRTEAGEPPAVKRTL